MIGAYDPMDHAYFVLDDGEHEVGRWVAAAECGPFLTDVIAFHQGYALSVDAGLVAVLRASSDSDDWVPPRYRPARAMGVMALGAFVRRCQEEAGSVKAQKITIVPPCNPVLDAQDRDAIAFARLSLASQVAAAWPPSMVGLTQEHVARFVDQLTATFPTSNAAWEAKCRDAFRFLEPAQRLTCSFIDGHVSVLERLLQHTAHDVPIFIGGSALSTVLGKDKKPSHRFDLAALRVGCIAMLPVFHEGVVSVDEGHWTLLLGFVESQGRKVHFRFFELDSLTTKHVRPATKLVCRGVFHQLQRTVAESEGWTWSVEPAFMEPLQLPSLITCGVYVLLWMRCVTLWVLDGAGEHLCPLMAMPSAGAILGRTGRALLVAETLMQSIAGVRGPQLSCVNRNSNLCKAFNRLAKRWRDDATPSAEGGRADGHTHSPHAPCLAVPSTAPPSAVSTLVKTDAAREDACGTVKETSTNADVADTCQDEKGAKAVAEQASHKKDETREADEQRAKTEEAAKKQRAEADEQRAKTEEAAKKQRAEADDQRAKTEEAAKKQRAEAERAEADDQRAKTEEAVKKQRAEAEKQRVKKEKAAQKKRANAEKQREKTEKATEKRRAKSEEDRKLNAEQEHEAAEEARKAAEKVPGAPANDQPVTPAHLAAQLAMEPAAATTHEPITPAGAAAPAMDPAVAGSQSVTSEAKTTAERAVAEAVASPPAGADAQTTTKPAAAPQAVTAPTLDQYGKPCTAFSPETDLRTLVTEVTEAYARKTEHEGDTVCWMQHHEARTRLVNAYLKAGGFERQMVAVPGDGECLWSAIAAASERTVSGEVLRASVVGFMRVNPDWNVPGMRVTSPPSLVGAVK